MLPGGYRLLVGRDMHEKQRFRANVVGVLVWSLGGTLVLALNGGLFVSRRMLSRVDQVSRTAQQIMCGELSRRMEKSGNGDEFDRLADSVNAMLDRINRLMVGMRLSTDNTAHDLRSPLTRLKSRIELALRDPPESHRDREALANVLLQTDAALAVFGSLLRIATAWRLAVWPSRGQRATHRADDQTAANESTRWAGDDRLPPAHKGSREDSVAAASCLVGQDLRDYRPLGVGTSDLAKELF